MDPSSGQHQEIPTHSMENMLVCSKAQDKKPRPQPDQALKCPRCDSTNTKFCYYNNYSLSQPRYFCKSCRRYWTRGGTLRNVPVGGGCRKNKRSTNSKRVQDNQLMTPNNNINPLTTHPQVSFDSNDLTLAFARLQKQCSGQLGVDEHDLGMLGNPNMSHGDIISNSSTIATPAFISSGFLEAQNNNFQNLYYGYGNGHMGCSGEMVMMPYENTSCGATTQGVTVTTMKQEMCNGNNNNNKDHENNKVLWGFPWQQFNGNGSIIGGGSGDFDAGKESWINGVGGTNWHGLLNSALM